MVKINSQKQWIQKRIHKNKMINKVKINKRIKCLQWIITTCIAKFKVWVN